MTNETKTLLEETLKSTLLMLQSATNLATQQIPLILQERLTYDFYYYLFFSLVYTALWVTSGVWCLYCIRKGRKNLDSDWKKGDPDWTVIGVVPFVLASLCWAMVLGNNIPPMIQIHVAPRLYLLEWLKEFIK